MADAASTGPLGARNIEQAASSLKPRRKLLLASLVAGNTVAESSKIARYSAPRAGSEALADLRKKVPELMDALGLSTKELLERLHKKCDATKTITASWNGQITDVIEVDDHGIQMDAIKLSLRLHGHLANDSEYGAKTMAISINNTVITE